MRLLFAATPDIAVPTLDWLATSGHQVEVLTNPDAPVGRSAALVASPIKLAALAHGLTVHQPARLDQAVRDQLSGRFDLLVSFAYGKIFGPKFLALFPAGGLNLHPSLLPRWRGPSPLNAALLHRDAITGLTIQRLALAMDSGDIVWQIEVPLTGQETAVSLALWAAQTAPAALQAVLDALTAGRLHPRPQNSADATYCSILSKADGRLDWTRSALDLDAQIRALCPWPGTWTSWRGLTLLLPEAGVYTEALPAYLSPSDRPGQVIGVDKRKGILVQTGEGFLVLRSLQLQTKKLLDYQSFINGNRDFIGAVLGDNA